MGIGKLLSRPEPARSLSLHWAVTGARPHPQLPVSAAVFICVLSGSVRDSQAYPTPNTYRLALYRDLVAQMVKNPPAMQETWVPPLSREDPLEGHGHPLQCSCLETPTDRGAWRAAGQGVAKGSMKVKPLSRVLLFATQGL